MIQVPLKWDIFFVIGDNEMNFKIFYLEETMVKRLGPKFFVESKLKTFFICINYDSFFNKEILG